MAKMIGFGAIEAIMPREKAPFTDRPKTTSAPSMASSRVRAEVSTACADFHWFMPSWRPR
jgi:hypothetical protein